MEQNTTHIINVTENPNSFSFRWGKVGDEAKVYFETEEDLKGKITAVINGVLHLLEEKKRLSAPEGDENGN